VKKISSKITILGAGPGGATTALFLAKAGIPCLLIEKETFPRDKICGDALSAKCVDMLRKIDPAMLDDFINLDIQVESAGINFIAPSLEVLKLSFGINTGNKNTIAGFISKRIHFDQFLINYVKQKPTIELIENCGIKEILKLENGWILKSNEYEVETELLIDASGANSPFARHHAGIEKEDMHYSAGLRAYYKNVKGMDKENYIELHFLKEFLPGYFWIFPLPNGEANVGVGVRSDVVKKSKMNLKKEMLELIQAHPAFKNRFAEAELIGDIKGFGLPLGSKQRPLSGNRYMLVGDAASLIDPFTGEGISNAMISGMKAAETVISNIDQPDFNASSLSIYDKSVYRRLGPELKLSTHFLRALNYPWLFNFVVRKANKNRTLRETMCCMFESVDLRKKLRNPIFYFKFLFNSNK
jgi:geranylgeranyl reductase family protein